MNMEIKVLDTEEARKVMIVEVENVKNIGYQKLSTYQGASKLLSYEVSTTGHASPSEGGCGHSQDGGAAEGGDKVLEEGEGAEGHSHDHSHDHDHSKEAEGGNGHSHGDEFGNDDAPGEYDVEVESAWQTEEGGNLLVHIALFERGWSVAIPMTYGFIMKPDGELLEEVEPEGGAEVLPS